MSRCRRQSVRGRSITEVYHIMITFTATDIRLQHYPHNPLVIRANIGKNTKYYFGNDVGRVLVDNGSSADILTWQCFFWHGF
jgi:hypothetical protein